MTTTQFEDLVDYDHLALYDEKIKQYIGTNANVIESITVGGTEQTPVNKVVALGSAAGATVEATGVASDTTTVPTTAQVKSFVEGKGYQTSADVSSAISSAIGSTYKAAGSKAANELTSALLIAGNLGNVYNLSTAITIAAADKGNWVENAENSYPAGTNVVIVDVGTSGSHSYKFDALPGFVDLSGYVGTSDITIVPNAQINALFSASSSIGGA